jgi:hypothetical protein
MALTTARSFALRPRFQSLSDKSLRLDPVDLQRRWNLNDAALSIILRKNVRTVWRYISPSNKTTPPEDVELLCWLLNYYFEKEGGVDLGDFF